uniref:Retrotransposon gag domain-containing protein n=1 Tax=Vitis vinifera TaxID=29760 RepID=A5BKQ9_VITVI|nr:hypothetical protein VITISV_031072 [Vitis vinifera]
MAHILIRISLIRISPSVHVARLSYPDSLKEGHTTLTNITSERLPQRIRTTDIHYPACHDPRSATYRSQQLPRSLSVTRRVMMALPPPSVIMTTQNISLPLKRETKLLNTIYMNLHTKRKLRGSLGTRGLNIGAICGNISLIQSPAKMATPSQSRSSGRGEEDNFGWRRAIERRQLASEQQLKALFQETERLREENAVLRIQASTSGPPRRRHSRGQIANSRLEPESIYPGTAGAIPETYNNVLPHRDPIVAPMVQNVQPHLAARQSGRNLPNEPPIGSISKRLNDMLSMPFYSHIIHYEPPRGFLVPKFSTYDGDLSEAFVGQYLCSAQHKQNISTLQNIKMQDNESLREFLKRFGQAVLQVEACSMDAVLQIFK